MNFRKAARYSLIVLSLFAASCTAQQSPQNSPASNDNGADCSGTAANQETCINNQNRMQDQNL